MSVLETLFPHVMENPDVFVESLVQTLQMFFTAAPFWFVFGIFFGLVLAVTKKGGLLENRPVFEFLDKLVNLCRSIPFVIMIALQEAGVIKVDPDKNDPAKGVYPAQEDITSNPKNIEIVPTDRNMIMSSLDDAAAGIANANAVVDYGKSPEKDSIFKIDPDPTKDVNKP